MTLNPQTMDILGADDDGNVDPSEGDPANLGDGGAGVAPPPDTTTGGAGIGSIGSAGANVLGGLLSAVGQNNANNQSWAAMQSQQAYGTYMSDTAHQREVADLKAAGLNPILSANAGASTPTSGMAVAGNTLASMASSAKDAVSSFQQAQLNESQMTAQAAQTANTIADTMNKALVGENIRSGTGKNIADTQLSQAQATQTGVKTKEDSAKGAIWDMIKPLAQKVSDTMQSAAKGAENLGGWAQDRANDIRLGPDAPKMTQP